ncbi:MULTISPECIES: glycosyl hydrolase family 28-related protein [unclassified Chryseobacterium]|uniref:glycosyl hydrolase family 28-related protein n=1 Tax=unclassified Chryseobacterium TaxID=2593645 RepID=UPI00226AE119|nr:MULTISPECIES: glycosyl hydrolase family 28-related protein [unclassified Chryseobacterium]
MKRFFLLLLIFIPYCLFYCKVINIKDHGAIGDGVFDNSKIFNSILKNTKNTETYKILIPEGVFLITNPIELPSNISIEGIATNLSILKVNNYNINAITILDNKNDNTYQYKYVRNLSIYGPEYGKNPFSWKNTTQNFENNIGIKILGIRNRIENCEIDGFFTAGLHLSSSYYNFINNCFIKNNKYGIKINKTCTSTYISKSELRVNSIAILIQDSYSIYVTDNILEANFSNFIDNYDVTNTLSNGKALILINSNNNYIEKNYFEEQFYNILLDGSNNNIFTSNFFAIGNKMPDNIKKKNQITFLFKNKSSSNTITNNNILTSTSQVQKAEMIFDDSNFSSNNINFDNEINSSLRKIWQNDAKKPTIK